MALDATTVYRTSTFSLLPTIKHIRERRSSSNSDRTNYADTHVVESSNSAMRDGKEIIFRAPNGSPMAVRVSANGAAF